MQIRREDRHLLLSLAVLEARVLRKCLKALIQNYQIRPELFDPKGKAAWYGTRGCESVRMSPEETREWLDNLYRFRGEHLRLLEGCAKQLAARLEQKYALRLAMDDAPGFLTVINDHRLLVAAQQNLGEKDIHLLTLSDLESLSLPRRNALLEIEVLGWIMEGILDLIQRE